MLSRLNRVDNDHPYAEKINRPPKFFHFIGGSNHGKSWLVDGSFQDGFGSIGDSGFPGSYLAEEYKPSPLMPGCMFLTWFEYVSFSDDVEVN